MNAVRFRDFSQASSLESLDEKFDLAIGYAGPDSRSTANLVDASDYMTDGWVFTCADSAMPVAGGDFKRKVERNCRKLPRFEKKVWLDGMWTELNAYLLSSQDVQRSVFVDVSAFPRRILAAIVSSIRDAVINGANVRITLGYRLASYSAPGKGPLPPNRKVSPVHRDFAGWPKEPGLPVHLIVGLGYEMGKALGAVEYIQPSHWRLFLPDSPEKRFERAVRKQNEDLIAGTSEVDTYQYQVLDPAGQFVFLSSMLEAMAPVSKPVLLPFGPKIFFAVCLLASCGYSESAVWHVSGDDQEGDAMTRPSKHSVYFSLSLSADAVTKQ